VPLSDIFQINVVASSPGLTAEGFGKPLILGAYLKSWAERYREYTGMSGVANDFRTDEPEYKTAAKCFSQNPRPPKIAVGRGTLPPTQRWAITPTVQSSTVYELRVGDKTASYTSDSSALLSEIIGGLVAAVNALAPAWQASTAYSLGDRCSNNGKVYEVITAGTSAASGGPDGYTADITDGTVHWKYVSAAVTASDQTTYMRVVLQTAGAWQALEVEDVNLLSIAQDHADPGVATDLAAIKLVDNTWYGLETCWNSKNYVLAAAAWVEANEKLYVAQSQDTECAMVAEASATDVAKTAKTSAYARTAIIYHPATDAFADVAWVGKCFPLTAGSETWKFKELASVEVVLLTPTQKANLDAKYANYYYDAGGVYITGEGKVAANEWIDVVRGRDALKSDMQVRLVNAFVDPTVSKVPYTDSGIQVVRGQVLASLRSFESAKAGFLVEDSSEVQVPLAADVSADDRANRVINDVTFTASLQGAIHSGTISGVVTY
jgi:hypothetical protein